jgi:phosphoglycerate kinase
MEREINTLSKVIRSRKTPKVFCLGGAKADDSFLITSNVLSKGIADKVLLSGVAALIFLLAAGKDVGRANRKFVKDQGYGGYGELIPEAKELLQRHRGQIKLPKDMAFENKGKRAEAAVDRFPDKKSMDIGKQTMENFSSEIKQARVVIAKGPTGSEIKQARVVIAKGPTGVFEINGFGLGTETLLKSIAESKALSVIGGGHLTTVAKAAGLKDDQPLPGIEAIKKAAKGKK